MAIPFFAPASRSLGAPAFFHHEPIRGLKSSAISVILIERTFNMIRMKACFSIDAGLRQM
jgi:hypothetical protein